MTTGLPPAGWYADPRDASQVRYWDGSQWTRKTQAAGTPIEASSPPPTGIWANAKYVLKRGKDFRGRSSRTEYWRWTLFTSLVGFGVLSFIGLSLLLYVITGSKVLGTICAGIGALLVFGIAQVLGPGLEVVTFAITVRRLHDTNHDMAWAVWAEIVSIFGIPPLAIITAILAMGGNLLLALLLWIPPLILGIRYTALLARPGDPTANRYGPPVQ